MMCAMPVGIWFQAMSQGGATATSALRAEGPLLPLPNRACSGFDLRSGPPRESEHLRL